MNKIKWISIILCSGVLASIPITSVVIADTKDAVEVEQLMTEHDIISSVESLQIKVDAIRSDILTRNKDKATVTQLNTNIENLTTEHESLTTKVTTLESTKKQLETSVAQLQAEIATKKAEAEAKVKAEAESKDKAEATQVSTTTTSTSTSTQSSSSTNQLAYTTAVNGGASIEVATIFANLASEKGLTDAEITGWAFIIFKESRWVVSATNASSGAYGLPQSLPGSKMATHGSDWATNADTQLRWMYDYMVGRYSSIAGAVAFWNANSWY